MINNQVIIYYKDGRLNKTRTAKSLLSYYMREFKAGRKPQRVLVEKSVF